MNPIFWHQLSPTEQQAILTRPAINSSANIERVVKQCLDEVQKGGDLAVLNLTERFDGVRLTQLAVSPEAIQAACANIPAELKQAIDHAYANITRFHEAQKLPEVDLETQAGVRCQVLVRPIDSVGLYIPSGSAPLFSTVLMLAIPAKIAGCRRVVLCSPPPVAAEIVYVAQLCGITEMYQIGGAQAIAAMAFGTESIGKVDKIFGPGNAYVTEAKRQVSQVFHGAAMDMPAGPSEVLVIADETADADYVAADLLSQAEHGADSQVILLTPSETLVQQTIQALSAQLALLPRAEIARQALSHSRLIVARDLAQCVAISNQYAPEHLIIQTACPRDVLAGVQHAGSVFLGAYTPESMGDYASGTNHVLPTYGFCKTYSSLGLADFSKRMTVQECTSQGFRQLAPVVMQMAAAEQLAAHQQAVAIRLHKMKQNQL